MLLAYAYKPEKKKMAKKKKRSQSKGGVKRTQKTNNRQPMTWILGGLFLVILLALGGLWLANRDAPATAAKAIPPEITVAQAYQKYQEGVFVLDVRTPEEWDDFHAPETTLIPLDQLASRVDEVPRDQEVVVVCRSGNRSQTGRDILLQAGFTQVTSMQGGLRSWGAAGYPLIEGGS